MNCLKLWQRCHEELVQKDKCQLLSHFQQQGNCSTFLCIVTPNQQIINKYNNTKQKNKRKKRIEPSKNEDVGLLVIEIKVTY